MTAAASSPCTRRALGVTLLPGLREAAGERGIVMPKNVVVCCDGTANEFAKHNTNVVKLYSALQHDPALQVGYYPPGLGTMEPAGALSTVARKVTKALGMAIGYGLENDIRDAYVFLMNHFRAGDRLFLF